MRIPLQGQRYLGFFPPYRTLEPIDHPREIPRIPAPPMGAALLWNLREGDWGSGYRAVRDRPPGVALMVLLPPAAELEGTDKFLELIENCRPHSVLPFLEEVEPGELTAILRHFPSEFALEVTDYLTWRGVEVDLDTRRLIRKTLELSENLTTVAGLARALYMSRRALGRRFMTRGLPVPSHWLHLGRILRASLRLQASEETLFAVACELGYPDGFSLSNQMRRLTGLRPSIMRECFGWEWIVEAWLYREAHAGSISPFLRRSLFPKLAEADRAQTTEGSLSDPRRSPMMKVAEGATLPAPLGDRPPPS